MDNVEHTSKWRIEEALSAQLELLSGGASGASTYRVHGLTEPCVLKVIDAQSADEVRARSHREIRFYQELSARIPLRTPHVLASSIDESGACALLIAAYEPMPAAQALREDVFTEIARQLAGFHALYWNQTDQLASLSWFGKPKTIDSSDAVQHASKTWHELAQRPQFREILTDSTLREIELALQTLETTPEYGPEAALTLCHGDCHLDNLLRDQQGDLIWADWQELRIGYGPSDLTFLLQRAEADGANVALDIVIAAYCKALEAADVQGVSEKTIKSAMHESERRTRLLHWPEYMTDATPEAMTRHLKHIFPA